MFVFVFVFVFAFLFVFVLVFVFVFAIFYLRQLTIGCHWGGSHPVGGMVVHLIEYDYDDCHDDDNDVGDKDEDADDDNDNDNVGGCSPEGVERLAVCCCHCLDLISREMMIVIKA